MNLGHWAQAESSFSAAERVFPDNSSAPIVRTFLLYHAGALDSLQRYLDALRRSPRNDIRPLASEYAGDLAVVHGRLKRGLSLWSESGAEAAALGTVLNVIADTANAIRIELATLGESPHGAERLDAVLSRSPLKGMALDDRPYFSVARAFARVGRPDRARAVLAEYDRDARDTTYRRVHEPALHEALAEIALAENKTSDAASEFRKADMLPDGPSTSCAVCLPVNLGRAFDAAHQSDSAIANYEKFLSTPYGERLDAPLFSQFADQVDPVYLAGVRRRLGELYEAKGDTAKAVAQYRAFVEQWKNAEPELQPRVAEVKRRIEALTPVEKARRH
jgi:tetratricopeptide (TPR) repeat protein